MFTLCFFLLISYLVSRKYFLNPSSLGRTTSVVGNGSDIFYATNNYAGPLYGSNRSLSSSSWSPYKNIDLSYPFIHGLLRRIFSSSLGSERCRFTRASKSCCSCTSPSNRVTGRVSQSYYRIIEGRLNVRSTQRYRSSISSSCPRPSSHYLTP